MAAENELSQKDVTAVMNSVFNTIMDSLAAGFSIFSCKHRNEHQGRNPANGATIDIAASNAPVFKASKVFKDKVNRKKHLFPLIGLCWWAGFSLHRLEYKRILSPALWQTVDCFIYKS